MQKGLGEIIRKLRKDREWSQVQLAQKAHVSQQLITKLETGAAVESRKIVNIARAFGLTVEQMLRPSYAVSEPRPAQWPFDIAYDRFAALPERDRLKVEGVIENAVREHERSIADAQFKSSKRKGRVPA
jgi:transcriptional regulator with XRE-family HTH domain